MGSSSEIARKLCFMTRIMQLCFARDDRYAEIEIMVGKEGRGGWGQVSKSQFWEDLFFEDYFAREIFRGFCEKWLDCLSKNNSFL